jgi:hypothetical protein
MSALPPKADIGTHSRDICFVPKADIPRCKKLSLFDHLVGAGESGLEPLFVERQKRAETQASSASLSVLVMTADPKRAFAILVSTLGHKIKVLTLTQTFLTSNCMLGSTLPRRAFKPLY